MPQSNYQLPPRSENVTDYSDTNSKTDYTQLDDWQQFPLPKKVMLIDIIAKAQKEYETLERMAHNSSNGYGAPGEWDYRTEKRIEDEAKAWKILKDQFHLKHEDDHLALTNVERRIESAKDGISYFGDSVETLTKCCNIFMAARQEAEKKITHDLP